MSGLFAGRRRAFIVALVLAALQQGCDNEDYAPAKWTTADIRKIRVRLEEYRASHNEYPTEELGLKALGNVPLDSWRNPFIYRFPGRRHPQNYDLFSTGPDRREDTADEVRDLLMSAQKRERVSDLW